MDYHTKVVPSVTEIVLLWLTFLHHADGYFIHLEPEPKMKWAEALELCRQHNMTLPILHTETDLNDFLLVRDAVLQSEYVTEWGLRPWVGLQHDGSNNTTAQHFTWIDGQTAIYAPVFEEEDDTNYVCVRLTGTRYLRLSSCDWKKDVFCQGSLQQQGPFSPRMYIKDSVINGTRLTSSRFVITSDDTQLPSPLSMVPLQPTIVDTVECFHTCAITSACQAVAVLHDDSSCYVHV